MNSKKQYQKFLASPFWKDIRAKALKRDKNTCRECGRTERLQVHHKKYRPDWYKTQLRDLITLCNNCHRFSHGLWVHLPIDDIEAEIKHELLYQRKPSKELWFSLYDETFSDYGRKVFCEMIILYCQMILKKDVSRWMLIRNSLLGRVEKFKHLAAHGLS